MLEKKIQSALWVGLLLLSVSACGTQSSAADTVADARAAALTNKVDDDKDGQIDENDEGLDEDEDGRVDESGEHHDACERRHHEEASASSTDSDLDSDSDSDSDAGVDDDADSEDSHSEHHKRGDSHKESEESMSREEKMAADIAAIDCSDVPSTTDTGSTTPVDAGQQ